MEIKLKTFASNTPGNNEQAFPYFEEIMNTFFGIYKKMGAANFLLIELYLVSLSTVWVLYHIDQSLSTTDDDDPTIFCYF